MYQHILIPTDGSELAERAVTHGLSLAKFVGAKVTVIIVEERPSFPLGAFAGRGAAEELASHTEQIKKHAASVLDRLANAAKQAGVPCDTLQVEDVQPYEAIVATATDRGCDLIVMASHGRSALSAIVLRRRDKQGADIRKNASVGVSLNVQCNGQRSRTPRPSARRNGWERLGIAPMG